MVRKPTPPPDAPDDEAVAEWNDAPDTELSTAPLEEEETFMAADPLYPEDESDAEVPGPPVAKTARVKRMMEAETVAAQLPPGAKKAGDHFVIVAGSEAGESQASDPAGSETVPSLMAMPEDPAEAADLLSTLEDSLVVEDETEIAAGFLSDRPVYCDACTKSAVVTGISENGREILLCWECAERMKADGTIAEVVLIRE